MTATYEQVALNRERGAEKSASIYSIEIQTCARGAPKRAWTAGVSPLPANYREEPDPSPQRRKIR